MYIIIIIGYYKKDSFNHKGIVNTVISVCNDNNVPYKLIDLYDDNFNPSHQIENQDKIKKYQNL